MTSFLYLIKGYKLFTDSVHQELVAVLGEKGVSTSLAVREQHGKDESYHSCAAASAVVFPTSLGEVTEVVKLCNRGRIPIIPYGTGTGLEGGIGAVKVSAMH